MNLYGSHNFRFNTTDDVGLNPIMFFANLPVFVVKPAMGYLFFGQGIDLLGKRHLLGKTRSAPCGATRIRVTTR